MTKDTVTSAMAATPPTTGAATQAMLEVSVPALLLEASGAVLSLGRALGMGKMKGIVFSTGGVDVVEVVDGVDIVDSEGGGRESEDGMGDDSSETSEGAGAVTR